MNSLDLQCSLFHGRNFPISPLKASKTNRELLQPGAWPATDFFEINVLAHILGLWRNHYESNSIVKILHTMCNGKDELQTGWLCRTHKNSHKLNIKYLYCNSCRSSSRLPLPCLPDCNSHLMLSSRWPKIYASGLSVCDNLWTAFSVTLGLRLFNALLYALVPVVSVFIKWNVGAFFPTVGCSLVPSSLLTVSVTQQENKSIDYLCIGMVEAVKFLSFPHFLHGWNGSSW